MSQAPPRLPVVLVVDDAEDIRKVVATLLAKDCQVKVAPEGNSGMKLALEPPKPDLILLDVEMPGMNGFDLCRALKANPRTASIPVLFLTAREEADYESQGFASGAVDYINKPINAVLLRARVRTHLGLANKRLELEALVRERTGTLEKARVQVIRRVARALEFHETTPSGNKVVRVTQYARLIAEASGANPGTVDLATRAAPLYDIGRVGIPAEILRKKGALGAPDWEQVRRHAEIGAEIIGEHADPVMKTAHTMALTHHERWDGKGYPKGLQGEQIPWAGRLMAIIDAFESMTTKQFHRGSLGVDQAAAEIVKGAGVRYDPKLVEAFKKAVPAMTKVRQAVTDTLGVRVEFDLFDRAAAGPQPARPAAPAPNPAAAKPAVPQPKAPVKPAGSLGAPSRPRTKSGPMSKPQMKAASPAAPAAAKPVAKK